MFRRETRVACAVGLIVVGLALWAMWVLVLVTSALVVVR